ncbi:putative membrane protein [Clostridiales bacterium]|nr:putative membrane protein [Clostridiales bacterium]
MIKLIIDALTNMVNSFGYWGIFIATSLEYGCFPVSSEVLLPFIGYFVYRGRLSPFLAILVSTAGGIIGSLACYCMGRFGKTFIEYKLKKFTSIQKSLSNAERVFEKYGRQSVLIARLFPIARTYISIPAGLVGMNVIVFIFYTAIGSFVWNSMLISVGCLLGEYWINAGSFIKEYHLLFYIITAVLSIVFIKLAKK